MSVDGDVTREAQELTDQRHLESGFGDQDVNRLERPRHHQERVRRRWMVGGDDFRAQRQVGLPLDVRTHQSTNIEVCDPASQAIKEPDSRWRFSYALLPPGILSCGGLFLLWCCHDLVSSGSRLPDKT